MRTVQGSDRRTTILPERGEKMKRLTVMQKHAAGYIFLAFCMLCFFCEPWRNGRLAFTLIVGGLGALLIALDIAFIQHRESRRRQRRIGSLSGRIAIVLCLVLTIVIAAFLIGELSSIRTNAAAKLEQKTEDTAQKSPTITADQLRIELQKRGNKARVE